MHTIGNNNNHNHRVGVYDGKIAGLYDLEETLGSGHFAVVKLARHVFTGEKVAVKVIDKTKLDEVSRAHLFQEVRCMKLVQHPNVVRLYEVIDTQTKLYLILELGDGGDLYDYIMKHDGGLTEQLAKDYFRQIVRAISYCHQLHVVHRDLKPENVVFFEKLGVVKLTDFGFSNKFCPGQKLETSCGSLAYSAPEILLGDSYDAPAVDVWSLGVILYMLVCGHPPFQEANDSETLTMIMDCKYTIPPNISTECKDLIGRMLVVAPDKRSTLKEIAQNPWLAQDNGQDHVPEYLPLVSRQQVSDDDHTLIIQKMVNGNIAAKEEIIDALDKNEYNHITATYFLLAERKLKAHRQEQAQKRRPELTLPVSNASRLSPKSRLQGLKDELLQTHQENIATNDFLMPTNVGHLNVPRTPGTDGTQTGRIRKCSIVQEEEDDEDDGDADEDITLNRRGSRSEGRINITVQDRIAETERLKKDASIEAATNNVSVNTVNAALNTISSSIVTAIAPSVPLKGIFAGIGGITIITGDNDPKDKLGYVANRNCSMVPKRSCDLRSYMVDVLNSSNKGSVALTGPNSSSSSSRSNSVDHGHRCGGDGSDDQTDETISTKFLVDSSTISIPVTSQQFTPPSVPKYKTMPSPTRSNTILPGGNCLNEIFEEGTDVGSSDSATTTPRPVARHAHYINNRTNSHGSSPSSSVAGASSAQRRSKFHKTRTASCSSSDASDDDSENRKKRAHKMVDSTKPIRAQRRDSHDDSSDSQDPGGTASSGGNASSNAYPIQVIVGNGPAGDGGGSGGGGGNSGGDQQKQQSNGNSGTNRTKSGQVGFRRHRAGRRRAGETRLRESQSLNRITEVQESELPLTALVQTAQLSMANTTCNNTIATATTTITTHHKSRGFSARLFHGFRKTDTTSNTSDAGSGRHHVPPAADEEVEMVLGVELAKALKVTESKSSSATKKLKMLGRYFQVHKKLCIPLPGIFQRGRLYKAQSCSSIMRDKVNQPNMNPAASRQSAVFSEKTRILRNCLGGARLLGSDGDINQNSDVMAAVTPTAPTTTIKTTPPPPPSSTTGSPATVGKGFSLKTSSPLHHHNHHRLSDASLCSSKC